MLGFTTSLARAFGAGLILGSGLVAACGGKQLGASADGGPFMEPDGATCVDIVPSSYDQSCATTSDCISVTSGILCSADCLCGGATINESGEARYQAAIAALPSVGIPCECPAQGQPECLHGICTICRFDSTDPSSCPGGG